ncbi:MAG: hypothetical protein Q8889_02405 [Candidatus Phytoplasma australasiaticum]|nr:hypothetical protein [Candidatus Phytoplasma australasiaticum]
MTRAVVADVATFVSNTLYSLATFPGASGAAWPSEFATTTGSPAGSVTQDGAGFGLMQANNASAWNGSQPTARLTTVSSVGLDLTVRVRLPGTGTGTPLQFWPGIGIGITSDAGGNGYFTSGYTLQIAAANNTWSLLTSAGASLSGDVAQTWQANTDYMVRIVRAAGLIQARTWLASAAQPTTWGYSGAASVTTAGTIGFLTGQGGDTTARPVRFNGITLTDGT